MSESAVVDGIRDLRDEHGRLAYAVRGSGPPLVFVPSEAQVSKMGRSQSAIGSLKPMPSRSKTTRVANDASPSKSCAASRAA